MKKKDLLTALDRLFPAVAARPAMEEMACVRVLEDRLRTTDGFTRVEAKLPESTGLDCLIPAAQFRNLLNDLPEDELTLEIEEGEVKITSGPVECRYTAAVSSGEMLDALTFEPDEWTPLPKGFLEAIRLCAPSAARKASRGALHGVCLSGKQILASNGVRIAIYTCSKELVDAEVVLPLDLIGHLDKYGDALEEWGRKGDVLYFRLKDGTVLGTKAIAGKFPDLSGFAATAKKMRNKVIFPEAMETALRRHVDQQVDTADDDREVFLRFADNTITLTSSDSIKYTMTEALQFEGELKAAIGFRIHPKLLSDILGRTREMRFDDHNAFVAFKDAKFLYLMCVDRDKKAEKK